MIKWFIKKIFVPMPWYGAYADLWNNEAYLKECVSVLQTRVWNVEVTETLRIIREYADNAETKEELKAYGRALSAVKKMLVLDVYAKSAIESAEARKNG